MTHITKLAAGLTGLAAIAAVSSPATAQINPYGQVSPYGTPYDQAAPYGYQSNGGVVGAIVNAVTGYGQYPQGNYGYEQIAQRGAVEMCARSAEQRLNSDQRYNGDGNGRRGYNDGYARNGYRNGAMFRGVGITNVERRMNGALRVSGIASSDAGQGNGRWNQHRGDDQRHGDSNGYDRGGDRYQNAGMDYRFTCKVNSRGAVTSLNLDRGTRSLRG
jgi:hypothetical protein